MCVLPPRYGRPGSLLGPPWEFESIFFVFWCCFSWSLWLPRLRMLIIYNLQPPFLDFWCCFYVLFRLGVIFVSFFFFAFLHLNSEPLWFHVGKIRDFTTLLCDWSSFRLLLNKIGPLWAIWGHPGPIWTSLVHSVRLSAIQGHVSHSGQSSDTLSYAGPFSDTLGHF